MALVSKAFGKVASVSVNSLLFEWSAEVTLPAGVPGERCIDVLATLDGGGQTLEELHRVDTAAGPDGTLELKDVSGFYFLDAKCSYCFAIRVACDGNPPEHSVQPVLSVKASTEAVARDMPPRLAACIPAEMWPTYVGSEHKLGEWLAKCPSDTVWTVETSPSVMKALWLNACFTLPSPRNPVMTCPNPRSRYCLDLTKGCPWLRSKKVRRHASGFRLTVNADYIGTFRSCERTHTENDKGTWITQHLIDTLDKCRLEEDSVLKVYSIELWEKTSGRLAAAIMALSVGDIFHDYTTATMMRDDRSAGAVLTKVLGHLLCECGFTLWYWGYKNPYMAEYDGRYGGIQLDNKEFWLRWRKALEGLHAPLTPLVNHIRLRPAATEDAAHDRSAVVALDLADLLEKS